MSNTRYIKTNTSDDSEICNNGKLGSLGYQKLPPVIYRSIRVNGTVMVVPVIQNLPDLSVVRGLEDVGDKNGVKWEIPDCSSSVVIYRLRDTNNNILDSGSVDCGETLELTAPDSTYIVELNGVNIEVGSILSGGNKLIEIVTTCDDASFSLRDSNNVEINNGSIPSGDTETIVAPDSSYIVQYEDGTLIEQGTIPSGGSVTIDVPNIITCSVANWQLTDSLGNVLDSGTIASGGSATIVAPDADVTLNSNAFISIPSGGSENITLIDQNDNVVTPINVTGSEIQIQAETKELFYRISVLENDEDVTIIAKETGTFTTITTTLTITLIEVNNVVVTLPFSIVPTDEIKLTFNTALTDTEIQLEGNYA